MATLANLIVSVSGNTAKLNKSLDKAQTRMDTFKTKASTALKAVRTAATGLAIGGGVALAGFGINATKDFIETGDELDKMSKRLGISVESLSELKFAAEQSGASLDDIEKGTKKLASTVFDANNGIKASSDAFEALGLNAAMLQDQSPEQQFLAVTEALAGVESASTRAALAQDVFGRAGTTLLPLVAEGAAGLAALRQQAIDLGNTFTTDAAAKAAEFADTLNELKQTIGGLGKDIAEKIVPILTDLVDWFIESRPKVEAFLTQVKEKAGPFIDAFVSGAGLILEGFVAMLGWITSNKPVLIALIVAIGVAIVTALGPVSLAILAILGIVTAIGFVRDNWDEIWNTILGVWETVSGAILTAYDSNFGWLLPGGPLIKAILFVRDNWDTIWKAVFATFDFLSSAISGVWLTTWDWLTDPNGGLQSALTFVRDTWDTVWNTVMTVWDTVSGAILRAYESNFAWLLPGGVFIKAIDGLTSTWDTVWGGIRSGFDAFISPIKTTISGLQSTLDSLLGALDRARSALGTAREALSNLPGAGVVGNIISALPGFQSGVQNFRGGMALVGERGPELVNLPRGSDVIPSGRGGSSMTTVVNMNFYGDIYGDDFDRRVNEARLRWERRGNTGS